MGTAGLQDGNLLTGVTSWDGDTFDFVTLYWNCKEKPTGMNLTCLAPLTDWGCLYSAFVDVEYFDVTTGQFVYAFNTGGGFSDGGYTIGVTGYYNFSIVYDLTPFPASPAWRFLPTALNQEYVAFGEVNFLGTDLPATSSSSTGTTTTTSSASSLIHCMQSILSIFVLTTFFTFISTAFHIG